MRRQIPVPDLKACPAQALQTTIIKWIPVKAFTIISLVLSVLMTACGNDYTKQADKLKKEQDDKKASRQMKEQNEAEARIPEAPFTVYSAADEPDIGKTYMPTGFYYLTNNEGVKMMRERTHEVYNLNRFPFVPVENMAGVKMEQTPMREGVSTSLVITLDREGTRSLAEGTGNAAYPYIALVVGGRLLFVAKNVSKITGGVMSVLIPGYTQAQIDEMEMAIRKKR